MAVSITDNLTSDQVEAWEDLAEEVGNCQIEILKGPNQPYGLPNQVRRRVPKGMFRVRVTPRYYSSELRQRFIDAKNSVTETA